MLDLIRGQKIVVDESTGTPTDGLNPVQQQQQQLLSHLPLVVVMKTAG